MEAARVVEQQLGPVDVEMHNAMTTILAPISDIAAGDFRRAVDVTLLGQVWSTKAAPAPSRHRASLTSAPRRASWDSLRWPAPGSRLSGATTGQ